MPYYDHGTGVIRIAIGADRETGGTLRTSDGSEAGLFGTNGTLTADKHRLIETAKML